MSTLNYRWQGADRLFAVAMAGAALSTSAPAMAEAQAPAGAPQSVGATSTNAMASADDAFGGVVGSETVGIYSETSVRGFNPKQAGNARIDGLYFDQLTVVPGRLREGADIRVGFTALNYPSPAPTGIVAHRIRPVGEDLTLNLGLIKVQYGGSAIDQYLQLPLVKDHFGIGSGLGFGWTGNPDGVLQKTLTASLIAPFRAGGIEIKPVLSWSMLYDSPPRPLITVGGPFVPELPRTGREFGQSWAVQRHYHLIAGAIARVPITERLRFRGGFFRSGFERKKNHSDIFAVRAPDGLASHYMLIDPVHGSYADSWDGLLSYRLGGGQWSHAFLLQYKGRKRHIESGGSDFFDFGDVVLGERDPEPRPVPEFGEISVGTLRQDNYTLGYIGRLGNIGQLNIGVTRTVYDASFRRPDATSRSSARKWLYNVSAMVRPLRHVSLYAGYVTGLEESGTAPESATNRNAQLPASSTRQIDAGIRVDIRRMQLVASLFEITKPYFSFDGGGAFAQVGNVRHRGAEFSASGLLTARLHVLAGAVLMDPQVSGSAVDAGLVGALPTGVPKLHARIDAAYRTDIFDGLTFTFAMLHDGRQALSSAPYQALDGRQVMLPTRTTFDLGFRHSFEVAATPVSIRFTVNNIFNDRTWKVIAPNTIQLDDTRRFNLHVYIDF